LESEPALLVHDVERAISISLGLDVGLHLEGLGVFAANRDQLALRVMLTAGLEEMLILSQLGDIEADAVALRLLLRPCDLPSDLWEWPGCPDPLFFFRSDSGQDAIDERGFPLGWMGWCCCGTHFSENFP